jgi:serpin B
MKTTLYLLLGASGLCAADPVADPVDAANGINRFGIALHQRLAVEGGNQVASPWSITSALAMTYAGAAGKTRDEMARTLHFGADEPALHAGIAAIAADLADLVRASRERVENPHRKTGSKTPMEIITANRLFGQADMAFEKPFLELLEKSYAAPLEEMDFIHQSEACRGRINAWVAEQTRERIKDLIPSGVLSEETRLVLANAIYMKASWTTPLSDEPELPFFANGNEEVKVPGLKHRGPLGYRQIPGGTIVAIPYEGGGLQFLLIVPDARDGLAALEKQLDAAWLTESKQLPQREITLRFPAFKLEPGRVMLAEHLAAMGMPSAFDQPRGSADFSRMAPRRPDDYLRIDEVIHKAFIAVDKHGTEAAAATAVVMMRATSMPMEPEQPLDIRVDRPFLFAIQHCESGACLFLGRVPDPR